LGRPISWIMAAMLGDIVGFLCSRVHARVIHVANHVDHEKKVAWFSISMHTCGSVPIVMVLCLAALWATGAQLFMKERAHPCRAVYLS